MRVPPAPWKKKNPEIPVLENYVAHPEPNFWEAFPSHYPSQLKQSVNVKNLKWYMEKCWPDWTLPQKRTALKAVAFLEAKVPAPLTKFLPGLIEKNAPSAVENGEFMTDVLATRVKKGFVAGPFEKPPMEGFRGNPLMAAVQKTKVRPILNLSSPKGRSFNDAVNSWEVDSLQMCTPRIFANLILKAGKNALISKTDIQDAYKLIPNPISDWRYYGFSWLGKFFVDTTTVFGSKTAPASFDPLPETVVNITCSIKRIPKEWVHRQLDDVPMIKKVGFHGGFHQRVFTNLQGLKCAFGGKLPEPREGVWTLHFWDGFGNRFRHRDPGMEHFERQGGRLTRQCGRVFGEKSLYPSGGTNSAWEIVGFCPKERFFARVPIPLDLLPEKVRT
jgi:hypothetical protein